MTIGSRVLRFRMMAVSSTMHPSPSVMGPPSDMIVHFGCRMQPVLVDREQPSADGSLYTAGGSRTTANVDLSSSQVCLLADYCSAPDLDSRLRRTLRPVPKRSQDLAATYLG